MDAIQILTLIWIQILFRYYAIYDKADTVHDLYIAKSFSGDPYGPYYNAQIFDSLYYKNVVIKLTLTDEIETDTGIVNTVEEVFPEEIIGNDKDEGIFSKRYLKYTFSRALANCKIINTNVSIPGLDAEKYNTSLIDPPRFLYPQSNNSLVSLTAENRIDVRWIGNYWNEIEFRIVVLSQYENSTQLDTLFYAKRGITEMLNYYVYWTFSASFGYNTLLGLLNSQLDTTRQVKYRKFADFSIKVLLSDKNFKTYMERYNLLADKVPSIRYTPLTAIVASKSSGELHGLSFDPATINLMKLDPQLARFKFVFE